jgi:hypothetical protein
LLGEELKQFRETINDSADTYCAVQAPPMRGLLNLILAVCLFVGMVGGSIAHAAETGGEPTSATAWLHVAGDADEVPADSDKSTPHHHDVCHGHDLAAPVRTCDARLAPHVDPAPRLAPDTLLAPAPSSALLRPPIA